MIHHADDHSCMPLSLAFSLFLYLFLPPDENKDEKSRHPSVSGHVGGGGNPAGFSGCSGLPGGAGSSAAAASDTYKDVNDDKR